MKRNRNDRRRVERMEDEPGRGDRMKGRGMEEEERRRKENIEDEWRILKTNGEH
jgi:hypothetical protein